MWILQDSPPTCQLDTADSSDSRSYMHLQCTDGYQGPACSECRRHGTKPFGRTGTLNCNRCRRASLIVLAYFGSTLLVMLLLCYIIQTTLEENLEGAAEAASQPVKASQLLKVVTPLFESNLASQQLLVHDHCELHHMLT